jgi:hypothetical protein
MLLKDDSHNIWIRKGDSGNIVFNGIPTDANYTVALSVFNPSNNKLIKQFVEYSAFNPSVKFSKTAKDIDELPVGEHAYALKLCNGDMEDTVIPKAEVIDGQIVEYSAPSFTVANKLAEGV